MKAKIVFSALVICCLSNSCTKEVPIADPVSITEDELQPARPPVYQGFTVDNLFGLNLYGAIYREYPDSNLCVSPFSVRAALSMVANGTAGEDLQEILRALNLPDASIKTVNEDYQNLTRLLLQADPKVTFEAANSFWYQKGIDVHREFSDDLTRYYEAETFPVDFGWPGTLDLMNTWVSDKTHGKITEIAKSIPPNTLMNLTNAIYFNGEWTYKFDRNGTKPWTFYKMDRSHVDIAIMSNSQPYRYYDHPLWHGLEMTYGNGNWAMYLFMPRKIGSLDKMTPWLIENWEQVRTEFVADKPILVRLPQFKIENNFNLKSYLQGMGVDKIFHPGANFSRMMDESLWIGEATHKTYIKVNEDGTEAAAITSFWGVTGFPSGLFFDHPFMYVIAERSTGLILFIGQVTEPK